MRTFDRAEQAASFARMEACTAPAHDFQPVYEPSNPKPVGGMCKSCGGTVSRASVNWYLRGLKAGAADPDAARALLPLWLKS